MKFHHIGIACQSIKDATNIYKKMGYDIGPIIEDEIQNVRVCFLSMLNHPILELIEPLTEYSPVNRIISKIGNSPYHSAYTTNDINVEISMLKKYGFLLISSPVSAIAFDENKICFMYNKDIGLIELIEENI